MLWFLASIAALVVLHATPALITAWGSLAIVLAALGWLGSRQLRQALTKIDAAQRRSVAILRSTKPAPAPVAVTETAKPSTRPESCDDTGLKRVRALTDRLWGGFSKVALVDLDQTAHQGDISPRARGQAFYERARWEAAQSNWAEALNAIQLSRIADPETDDSTRRARTLMEADFLLAAGRASDSRELLEHSGLDPRDTSVALRIANAVVQLPGGGPAARLMHINSVYSRAGFVGLERRDALRPLALDNLVAEAAELALDGPLVSVVVPAFRAAATLGQAISSLIDQTWRNIEILVVDDKSDDATREVANALAESDPRIRVLERTENGGAYAARNTGVAAARGEFVTIHDSDDWAHPQKIATQVKALLPSTPLVATMSHHVRVLDDLTFTMPGGRPEPNLMITNFSSLMLRRRVFDEIGCWDVVRFGGDAEFIKRVEAYYGLEAIERVAPDVPLSLVGTRSTSLTRAGATGLRSTVEVLGARRLYQSAFKAWHASDEFRSTLPLARVRPFVAPRLSVLGYGADRVHLDVVVMSDFSLPDGTDASVIAEIRSQQAAGVSTGLVHHPLYDLPLYRHLNTTVLEMVDGETVRLLAAGEKVSCDTLVIRFPRAFEKLMDALPDIEANEVVLVVDQLPQLTYSGNEEATYRLDRVVSNLSRRFGGVRISPMSPQVRAGLLGHHGDEFDSGTLSADDWVGVLDGKYSDGARTAEHATV